MTKTRAILAVSTFAICGEAACAQPGIVEVNEMSPPVSAQDGSIVAQDSSVGPLPVPEAGVLPVQDTGVLPAQDTGVAPPQDSGITPLQDSAVADAGPAPLPPCPSGYTCDDPAAMIKAFGAEGMVTDPSGKQVTLSCGKGGAITCDPKNPKASCPDLPNAYCAHVVIVFPPYDTYSCAQNCAK